MLHFYLLFSRFIVCNTLVDIIFYIYFVILEIFNIVVSCITNICICISDFQKYILCYSNILPNDGVTTLLFERRRHAHWVGCADWLNLVKGRGFHLLKITVLCLLPDRRHCLRSLVVMYWLKLVYQKSYIVPENR